MRAWTVPRYGEPRDVLELRDVAAPTPDEGQVLVDVEAAACNFADVLHCRGEYQERPPLPFTPGLELAGSVVGTGERVVGAPVLPHGAFADQAVVAQTFPWPAGMTAAAAAGLFVAYQTGWCALHHRTSVAPGETLLVHAAAGGVGAAAVQLGTAAGLRVIATVGSADKIETARQLGADHVLGPDADLVGEVKALTDGRGADVVYDPVGGDTFDASRRAVAWEGRILVIGFAGGRIADAPTNHALVKNYSVIGVHWAAYRTRAPELIRTWQGEIERLLAAAKITPLVGHEYRFDELPDALEALAARATTGRVVITVR